MPEAGLETFPFGGWGLALLAAVVAFGVAAGLRRIVRKPAMELSAVDRMIGTMLLGRFFGPLRARFQRPHPYLACPLCGAANGCVPAAQGSFAGECWCTQVSVDPEALARIPEPLKGKACLCRACATGQEAAKT